MLKQGWMLKSQDFSTFSELWISSWRDAVCWQITQRSFVSDWEWPCVVQCDAGHTRIKTKLDKIGTKKQEVKQSVLTLSSLMLKPNRNRTFDAMTWSDFSIFPGSGRTRSTIKHQVNELLTGWQNGHDYQVEVKPGQWNGRKWQLIFFTASLNHTL